MRASGNTLLRQTLNLLVTETAAVLMKPVSQAVLLRAALVPTAEQIINLILKHLPGMKGHVDAVEVGWLHPTFRIRGLSLTGEEDGAVLRKLTIEECAAQFQWRHLLKKQFIGEVRLIHPVLHLDAAASGPHITVRAPKKESVIDFAISRFDIIEGEIHLDKVPGQEGLDLRMSEIVLSARNISNSLELTPTLKATLEARAKIMDQGQLTMEGGAYPFADTPVFDLDIQILNLNLFPLNPLFRSHLGVEVESGTLNAYAEIAGNAQGFKGYVKPLAEHVSIKEVRGHGVWDRLKGFLVRRLARLLKNKKADRIATKIQYEGDWLTEQVDLLGAVGNFLKNAFREAFRPALDHSIYFTRETARDASINLTYSKKPQTRFHETWMLMKAAAARWSSDNAARMSAALSYYSTFSLAPLLILVIAVAGLAFGRSAAEGHLVDQIGHLVGPQSAEAIQSMIQAAWKPTKGVVASIISIMTLLFGAVGVLLELKQALNKIWRVSVVGGWKSQIRDRIRSLGLILAIGFLLLVSLIISAVISAMNEIFGAMLPIPAFVLQAVNESVAFIITFGLISMIYKWLPDTEVAWRDVWVGSGVTSGLFSIGKLAFGIYLGKSSISSAYGAAGSVIVVLLWIYYNAMILYFGAEFTAIFAEHYGSRRFRDLRSLL